MVNLGKELLKQFIESGAVLSTPSGKYLLCIGLNSGGSSGLRLYLQDFFGPPQIFSASKTFELTKPQLEDFLNQEEEQSFTIKWQQPSIDTFRSFFELTKNEIKAGRIEKLVPYAKKNSTQLLGFSEKLQLLKTLLRADFQDNYLYFLNYQNIGFCGLTPEALFYKKDCRLKTMALAGTKKEFETQEKFVADEKENIEHGAVVNFLVNKLGLLGRVKSSETLIKKYGTLLHLFTPLEVELNKNYNYKELVSTLHPTPALGGAPQVVAIELLKKINLDLPREFFGAPFGYETADEAWSVVLIRGLFWSQSETALLAGCGVVEQSSLENEWAEINLKFKAMENIFGLNYE